MRRLRFQHESLPQRVRFASGEAAAAVRAEAESLGATRVMVIAAPAEAELAERIAAVRAKGSSVPVADVLGPKAARGAAIGEGNPVQLHSLRLPSYVIAVEAIFGAPDERLTIRHDAGSSAAPYVAGTLLAVRKVVGLVGLTRGLDSLI